jgi:hypothetical protein
VKQLLLVFLLLCCFAGLSQVIPEARPHKHTPHEQGATDVYEKVIYLNPNQPQNTGCANLGFNQYSFSGWTGGTGGVAAGPVFYHQP